VELLAAGASGDVVRDVTQRDDLFFGEENGHVWSPSIAVRRDVRRLVSIDGASEPAEMSGGVKRRWRS
jgi:hypothetical protein